MPLTISGLHPAGYDLTAAGQNPVTVTGSIGFGADANFAALQGETVAAWTVLNQGTIDGGTAASGVDLLAGGTVANANGALIAGFYGVVVQALGSVLDNSGSIDASAGNAGVFLTHGGSVTNESSGRITSGRDGIYDRSNSAGITNLGMISAVGTGGAAVDLFDGGAVTNLAGATLAGEWAVSIGAPTSSSVPAYVLNDGVLNAGAQSGVFLGAGGTVVNQAAGIISGNWAVAALGVAATVVNAGTMEGTGGTAATLASGLANRVVLEPGGVFVGTVDGGGTSGGSVLELGAGGAGLVSGIGTQFVGFATVTADASAYWTLQGTNFLGVLGIGASATLAATSALISADTITNAGSFVASGADTITAALLTGAGSMLIGNGSDLVMNAASVDLGQSVVFTDSTGTLELKIPAGFAGTIGGFTPGDRVIVDTPEPATFEQSGSIVAVMSGASTIGGLQFESATAASAAVSTPGALMDVLACFAAGTRIKTENGEVPVQELQVGDHVITARGDSAPIVWIGHSSIDCRHLNARWLDAAPVRIRAGAFGKGLPWRDLLLSQDHSVHIYNVLIPVRYLLNGATILWQEIPSISYYHIELPRHNVLLAEGLPVESYLDTGNRTAFESESNAALRAL